MPTYQYACTVCGHQMEAVQSFSDAPLTVCPECDGLGSREGFLAELVLPDDSLSLDGGAVAPWRELAEDGRKQKLAMEICLELSVHAQIEEEIFYPACEGKVDEDLLKESYVEHDGAKVLIAEILGGEPSDEFYDSKVKVLSEEIEHHVQEEEKRMEGLFAQARKAEGAGPELPAIDLTTLILSFSHNVLVHLGDAPDPVTGEREVDLPLARQNIELIALLQEKTRGNLSGEEERVVSQALFDLRMRYVEVVKRK